MKSKSQKADRLLVEVSKHRMPMKQILDKREIREAMAELEKYRRKFNEQEFLYGAKVFLSYGQGECWAILKRPESDKEYSERQAWLAEEQRKKAERLRIKQLREHELELKRQEEAQRAASEAEAREVETLMALARKHGLKVVDILEE